MRKLNKREFFLTYLVVISIFILLGDKFFILPFRKKHRDFFQKIKETEVELKTALLMKEKKDNILSEYATYKDFLAKKDSPQEIMAEFLKEIEKITKESNISVISLNPREEKNNYKIKLKGEAKIEGILSFFYKIQKSRFLIKVESFSLTLKDEKSKTLILDANLVRTIL